MSARAMLQCGHGLSTVENLPLGVDDVRPGDASMRPRPLDRGEQRLQGEVYPGRPASMRPRPLDRGERERSSRKKTSPPSFNAANGTPPGRTTPTGACG